jgi:CubicO group peptidase (beta-lactamase class C family)
VRTSIQHSRGGPKEYRGVGYPSFSNRTIAQISFLLLALALPYAFGQKETADIRQVLEGKMLPDVEVRTFEHSETLYPSEIVARGGGISTLPPTQRRIQNVHFVSNGKQYDLFDYLAANRVVGLLVLKDGKVSLEDYELGFGPQSRWASFSMAKSVSSTLIGVALQQGLISSLDAPVGKYVSTLRGSAYETVSIRNVLRMASGVAWDETYTDPDSDCRKLTELQLRHVRGASMAYMATLRAAAPQGSIWNYNSGEANIAGAVLEGATRRSLATYLSETLWSRLGMERNATWWTESPGGMGLSGVGIGATLRDYGRFGLFVQDDGVIDGKRIVPKGWFQEAGSPQKIGNKTVDYGYLWWPVPVGSAIHEGAFQAQGIFGQRLYINRRERLVVVVLSARSKPVSAPSLSDLDFFAAVAHALH